MTIITLKGKLMEHPPDTCPYCGSTDLETSTADVTTGTVEAYVYCNQCPASWTNLYEFSQTIEMEAGE